MNGLYLAAAERFKIDSIRLVPIKSINTMSGSRSNFAGGYNKLTGDLIVLGGLSGGVGAARYPTTALHFNTRTKQKSSTALPSTYTWASGIGVDDNLYFLDGHNGAYNGTFRRRAIAASPSTLTPLADAPTPYRHTSIILHNAGKIYRLGGWASNEAATRKCHVYNIATNTWDVMADMPFTAIGHFAAVYDNKLFIMGSVANPVMQIYNTATNTWSTFSIPRSPVWGSVISRGRFIYVISGTGAIDRYDLLNLSAKPRQFKVTFETSRYVHTSHIDESTNELHIVGGCVSYPGQALYDDASRSNQIVTIDMTYLN